MKKHILFALFLSLATSICYSQVKINVQAGIGFNDITKEEFYKTDIGYRFGVEAEIPIDRIWSFQTGVQFLNRKSTAKEDVVERVEPDCYMHHSYLYMRIRSTMNAICLQFPIKIAACLPLGRNLGLQISAGPYIAYGIGGETDMERINISLKTDQPPTNIQGLKHIPHYSTFNEDNGLKRFDIGLNVGADFKYKSIFVGCEVEYGLIPVNKKFPKNTFRTNIYKDQAIVSPHNFGVELHVGYSFRLGKSK